MELAELESRLADVMLEEEAVAAARAEIGMRQLECDPAVPWVPCLGPTDRLATARAEAELEMLQRELYCGRDDVGYCVPIPYATLPCRGWP